jgi:hypothetical protein
MNTLCTVLCSKSSSEMLTPDRNLIVTTSCAKGAKIYINVVILLYIYTTQLGGQTRPASFDIYRNVHPNPHMYLNITVNESIQIQYS